MATILGTTNNEVLYGTAYDDLISGRGGNDTVYGLDGNDDIRTSSGDDYVDGGYGNDIINTSSGNDTIYGGYGTNNIQAGFGDDYINSYWGALDTINGGPGYDTLAFSADYYRVSGENISIGNSTITQTLSNGTTFVNIDRLQIYLYGTFNDTVTGGGLDDTIYDYGGVNVFNTGGGNDVIGAYGSSDTVNSGSGNDSIYSNYASVGAIDGSLGLDFFSWDASSGRVSGENLDISNSAIPQILSNGTTVVSIEQLTTTLGGNFDDAVTTGELNDTINDYGGNDILKTNGGNDYIYVNGGNDQIYSGIGNDTVVAGYDGMATIRAGSGDDSVTVYLANGDIVYGEAGNDTIGLGVYSNSSTGGSAYGGDGNDYIYAYYGNNTLDGGNGNDTIYTGYSYDSVNGGNDNDYVYNYGGDDYVVLGAGDDQFYSNYYTLSNETVYGNSGNDIISTYFGEDYVIGGLGADSLSGGGDGDFFIYQTAADSTGATSADTITDFVSGLDKIDLSLIDANTIIGGNQAFSWIGNAAFSGAAGQLRGEVSGSNFIIYGNTDADLTAEFRLVLSGVGSVNAATDFFL